jgi:glycosyltransferase involved in cell wall biosynthesis
MTASRISVLFMVSADSDNTNAQSLNAREIALRLDPDRFVSVLFYEKDPDLRLQNLPHIHLVRLPPERRTWRILKEMRGGHHIIAYVDYSPASYLFLHLPKLLRGGALTVLHAEAPVGQLAGSPRLVRFFYCGVLPRCDVHTGITDFVARDLKSLGFQSRFTLPVGVDTSRFVPPSSRYNVQPTVLFAGTLIERKGAHLLVDAAQRLPDAQFMLVGAARDGFDEVLRKRCQESGVTNLRLLGSRPQAELLQIMQQSDIFVLPSRLEGLPKVTLEAAATGLPCIVFRDYETPSVVDEVTGFQVAKFEEMVARLRLLIRDSELRLRMGAAAVQHAKTFDWNIIAGKWQEAYLQMAASQER